MLEQVGAEFNTGAALQASLWADKSVAMAERIKVPTRVKLDLGEGIFMTIRISVYRA